MPIDTTRRLDAVNLILSSVGISAVSSLSAEGDETTAFAEGQLDASDREVQTIGWWFNSYERTYSPASDEILMPSTVLYVEGLNDCKYALRSGKLFDLVTGLTTFTAAVTVRVVEMVPFDDLPEVARGLITAKASRRFAERHLGDPSMSRYSRLDEQEAFLSLRKAHLRSGNFSIWGPSTKAALRRGGNLDHYTR
jgi:hypothetical protein